MADVIEFQREEVEGMLETLASIEEGVAVLAFLYEERKKEEH